MNKNLGLLVILISLHKLDALKCWACREIDTPNCGEKMTTFTGISVVDCNDGVCVTFKNIVNIESILLVLDFC
jgi:hypothetical protein